MSPRVASLSIEPAPGRPTGLPTFRSAFSAPLRNPQSGAIAIEIVVDNNSVEVFAEDGETVLTNLIYPSASSQGIAFYSTATPPGSSPARIRDLELIPLVPPAR